MGAIQFRSPTSGIGITADHFPCFGKREVTAQPQPVWLASTRDGGRSWHATGAPVPRSARSNGENEEVIARSLTRVLALVDNGRLVGTVDGGTHWSRQAIPGPVVHIADSMDRLWALACPATPAPTAEYACRPELWSASTINGRWSRLALPALAGQDAAELELAVTTAAIVIKLPTVTRQAVGELLTSTDHGRHWTTRVAPTWDRIRCNSRTTMTAFSPRTFWLLCIGGAAAGSSTKGLVRSTNAGRTWNTVSAAPSLTRPPAPGSIPLEEPSALAAGSQTRLWLTLTNGLAQSHDAGHHWTNVPSAFDPFGWPTVIDALDSTHAWVLAAGAGMWRTTDGQHWLRVGPLNTR